MPAETPPRPRIGAIVRAALFVYVVALCCPVEVFPIDARVDGSWQLGLNLVAHQDLRFGEDLLWPSGPFAYLDSPMPVGNNLAKGIAAQLALWLLAALALADPFFVRRLSTPGLWALAVGVAVGAPVFHFNTQGADALLSFVALLLAASAVTAERWRGRLAGSAAAAGLAGVFKISAAAVGGAGAVTAALILWRRHGRNGLPALALVALIGPGTFLAAYLAHNPSLDGFVRYAASLVDLSLGYGAAMSYGDSSFHVSSALAIAAIFLALLWHLHRDKQIAQSVALVFLIPMFLTFKHGFVRQDIHMWIYFCFASLAIGATLAHADWRRLDRTLVLVLGLVALPLSLIMSCLSAAEWTGLPYNRPAAILGRSLTGAASLQHLNAVWDLDRTREELLARSREAHREAKRALPSGLRDRIGARPVAALSPYSGELFLQGLNLQVLPIVQKYSAYTPSLDAFLANALERNGPDLLLFEWQAIDRRHPLLETPLTWSTVWRGFDCVALEGGWVLLERRAAERFSPDVTVTAHASSAGARLDIPDHNGPLFASIEVSPVRAGRLFESLFRTPPIEWELVVSTGESIRYRVFPAAFESKIPLSPLPLNLGHVAQLLAPDSLADGAPKVRSIQLGAADGAGVAFSVPSSVAIATAAGGAQ